MSWRGIQKTPARKPAFIYVIVFASGTAIYYMIKGIDIPPGILSLINNMVLVVSGMYGLTSSSEAIYGGGNNGMLQANQSPYYYGEGCDDEAKLENH